MKTIWVVEHHPDCPYFCSGDQLQDAYEVKESADYIQKHCERDDCVVSEYAKREGRT